MSDLDLLSCPACGGTLDVPPDQASIKCPFCGSQIAPVSEEPHLSQLLPGQQEVACPIGSDTDMVQKVSAIVQGQTFSVTVMTQESYVRTDSQGKTHTHTRTVPRTGTQVSSLAQKLTRPPEPNPPSPFTDSLARLVVLFSAGGLGKVLWLAGMVLYYPFLEWWNRRIREWWNLPVEEILIVIGLVILSPAVIGYAWYLLRRYKPRLPQLQADYEENHAEWEKAMRRWDRCYYCHRHDVVFELGRNETSPPDGFQKFLFRES